MSVHEESPFTKLAKGAKGAVARLSQSVGDRDSGEVSHLLTHQTSWVIVPPSHSTLELPLLAGESLALELTDVTFLGRPWIQGTLAVTNYRIYFHADTMDTPLTLDIPLGFVTKVDKVTAIQNFEAKSAVILTYQSHTGAA